MTDQNPRLLKVTGTIVNIVIILNIIGGAIFLAILGLLFALPSDTLFEMLQDDGITPGQEANYVTAFRFMMAIGICVVVPTHIIFTRLKRIIASVREGEPFSTANALFLRTIAWALLAINLLDLAYGAIATWLFSMLDQNPAWGLSLTGWFAVLLLFVLSRIFEQGAAMRDDLEGTV